MYLIFSLDAIFLFMAFMLFLGIGWGSMGAAWLWQHAVIIGIVLLIIHIILSFGHTVIAAEGYSIFGIICSTLHAIIQPLLVAKAYSMSAYEDFGFGLFVFWLIVLGGLHISENFWYKATDTRNGLSYGRLLINTFLSVGICLFLIIFFSSDH